MKIIHLGGKGYIVLGVVSANTSYSGDELKSQWRLADTILQKDNEFYICPVYNTLIHRHNGRVCPYPVFEMNGMGTPEELEIFLSKMEQ